MKNKKIRLIVEYEGSENPEFIELIEKTSKKLKYVEFYKYDNKEYPTMENYCIKCTDYMYKKFSKEFAKGVKSIIKEGRYGNPKDENEIDELTYMVCRRFNLHYTCYEEMNV